MAQQAQDPGNRISYYEMIRQISKASGVGQRTICMTVAEYRKQGTVSSPNKRKRRMFIDNVDDCDKNAIRQKVHNLWLKREIPTPLKIFSAVNEDESLPTFKRSTFYELLKSLNFEYVKKNRDSVLLERNDIVCWRRRYLQQIKYYRQQGRPIYFLDETWVNVGETTRKSWVDKTVESPRDAFLGGITTGQNESSGNIKSKRLIVLHIGSSDGFLPGGLLCFESKTIATNYHYEMNGDIFFSWFVKIVPQLKENAVIVMDNIPYHSVKKDQIPVMSWKKQDTIQWLERKGQIIEQPMVKAELMDRVNALKPQYNTYVIDEYAEKNNKIVLRLPPYHCELNPMELAWSSVKHYVRMNNTTFNLHDVKQLLKRGVDQVTAEMWKNYVIYVIKEEEKLSKIDFISDEMLDNIEEEHDGRHVLTMGTDDTSSDSDSD